MGIQRGLQFLSLVIGGIGLVRDGGLLVWPRKSCGLKRGTNPAVSFAVDEEDDFK